MAEKTRKSFKLIMMRHAESVPPGSGPRDHDRPITKEGEKGAQFCANELKSLGWLPGLILCSDSVRTKETVNAMAAEEPAFKSTDTHFLSSLYTISALDGLTRSHLQEQVLELVDESTLCVMCVGHNRGWEEAVSDFCGSEIELQTGNAALLESKGASWKDVFSQESWKLLQVIRHKTN
eukprot:CAMPEP_0196576852 /NCGR_PEP_ID=MMETSP1081-20130531/6020_1 /TAXON_ID=36882 /ORGANISM="Pyramimonas amylifera, Strain CCMP720" /LENGTH=178 /DNA_ID=CAMNT_0041895571 /DNA_START=288 /DNA_END=824 /DNA_ORIENTATION=+